MSLQIQGESQGPVKAATGAQYRGVLGTILTMVRTEGPSSLYNGLVAGLQRQMSFASVRIGLYDSVKQFYTKGSESKWTPDLAFSAVPDSRSSLSKVPPHRLLKTEQKAELEESPLAPHERGAFCST